MRMNSKSIWAVQIKNAIIVALFVVLAIHFEHWWISLFSALFLTGIQTKPQFYYICDTCGSKSPVAVTQDEAERLRKKAGWVRKVGKNGWEDICPDCQAWNNR